jgi:phosphoserine aminotransferase
MLPANLLAEGATADYLNTGSWSKKAIEEARRYGNVHVAASSEGESFARVPGAAEITWSEAPVYAHFTSNNTIFGTQWQREPEPPASAFLACDASSDAFSRPLEIDRYGVFYAGAQKNLGPSGTTLVVIRRDLLGKTVRDLPTMLRYETHAKNESRYNTPPTFGIYLMGRVFRWILASGGLAEIGRANQRKAAVLYDVIDAEAFYTGTADRQSRSTMNVTFRTPDEELDATFVAEATRAGFSGLKGHRSVGGMRASIYNAFPRAGCEALASFMKEFARTHG